MSGFLFYLPTARALSLTGRILPGWEARFFLSETMTPTPVYSDGDLQNPFGTTVQADSAGMMPPIYLDPDVLYRVQMYDEFGVLLPNGDVDPIDVSRGSGGGGGIESIVAGGGIDVDATDPANPIVSATGSGPHHEVVEFFLDAGVGVLSRWDTATSVTVNISGVVGLYGINFPEGTFEKFPVAVASIAYPADSSEPTTQLVRVGRTGSDFVEVIVTDMDGNLEALIYGVTVHAREPLNWIPPG